MGLIGSKVSDVGPLTILRSIMGRMLQVKLSTAPLALYTALPASQLFAHMFALEGGSCNHP